MIYTITLNPALDRTIWVDRIRDDVSNRIVREDNYAGGKSIDVSKVLKNLGVDNTALGFVGGFAGMELEGRLLNDGIQTDFVRVSGETRTNIVIHEIGTGRQLAFNARGPEVRPHELIQMIDKIQELPEPQMVSIGGSLPRGLSAEIYRKIINLAKRCHYGTCQSKVILDVDGESLRVGIEARPDVIKPNIHELSQLVGRELREVDEVRAAARDIRRKGVDTVLVSMGPRGILLVSSEGEWIAEPPGVEVKNTIGAGDSSVAGFMYGLAQARDLSECLTYAAAAGTATTLKEGTALASLDDFNRLVPQVSLTELSAGRVGT
ncbi:MAG: 1-phosphofructokinase [Methanosaeta sp. PtaB.Bin039]|nr:MAG: 1-phosphofructokinase [Methanosaeta sp. PtaB.Bin039]OPY46092.1 MAG: 1-phosphofructokinase [Methanosaeta sp. PtaU1.Bin028]HOT06031.1 1-phosphofructokinase [Methanotrichaceae archaeon]HQF16319.1 1-phosphofructokinase [Methanotrichaceae archaeon]HQI90091.1 1-phosphofructokinase [Methanotrichaceae archaeon]